MKFPMDLSFFGGSIPHVHQQFHAGDPFKDLKSWPVLGGESVQGIPRWLNQQPLLNVLWLCLSIDPQRPKVELFITLKPLKVVMNWSLILLSGTPHIVGQCWSYIPLYPRVKYIWPNENSKKNNYIFGMVNPKKRPNKNHCLGRGSDLPRILESGSFAEKRHWGSWDGPMWGVNGLNCLKKWAPPKVGNNYFITFHIYIYVHHGKNGVHVYDGGLFKWDQWVVGEFGKKHEQLRN